MRSILKISEISNFACFLAKWWFLRGYSRAPFSAKNDSIPIWSKVLESWRSELFRFPEIFLVRTLPTLRPAAVVMINSESRKSPRLKNEYFREVAGAEPFLIILGSKVRI